MSPAAEGFKASGLDLSTYQGLMKGSKFGTDGASRPTGYQQSGRAYPGQGGALRRAMPHNSKPLPSCLRDEIWTWIFQGAKDN